jgi:hypothetical protein
MTDRACPDFGRDEAEGYEPFIAAEGWREETSIRLVPESAVAEAVAAERKRIRQLAVASEATCQVAPAGNHPDRPLQMETRPFADLIGDPP